MNTETIKVVEDWNPRPFGRYPNHSEFCGKNFRTKLLQPMLQRATHVTVDLTGYNRYGRSFLDEAFGGLVRDEGWTPEQLHTCLDIIHEELPSIPQIAWFRIKEAADEQSTK